MRKYQLIYLLSPELTEEELRGVSEKINNLFGEIGAILNETRNPIKKYLGSPIENKNEAFLAILDFDANPEKINELKKVLESEQKILRHVFLIRKPVFYPKKPRARERLKETDTQTKIEKPKEKKVGLKEIEKKLEEILE